MKTPEELALEYADGLVFDEGMFNTAERAFLAGYQAAAPQWISVKDRLPEVEEYVVIFWNDMPKISYLTVWEHFAIGSSGIIPKPTHWMPLPKSPEK